MKTTSFLTTVLIVFNTKLLTNVGKVYIIRVSGTLVCHHSKNK